MNGAGGRAIEPGELKALVRQLVKAAGGVEACAVELGVSAERVSQYQRTSCPDQMGLLMISRLEAVVQRGVVTAAASRAAEGAESGAAGEAIGDATVGAVGSAAALMARVHVMEADGHRSPAEVRDVQLAAAAHLREAQEAFDAAMRLSAGGQS